MSKIIKHINTKQELLGENTLTGAFWLVANHLGEDEIILGYTKDGTINIEREYKDASQNQSLSNVKGLKSLESLNVSFETSSLQLDEMILKDIKGLKRREDEIYEETNWEVYEEEPRVSWDRYIDELSVIFEYTDGRVGRFIMYNAIETSSESIEFSRGETPTVSIKFEANAGPNTLDRAPYKWMLEAKKTNPVQDVIDKLGKQPFHIEKADTEEKLRANLKSSIEKELNLEEIGKIKINTIASDLKFLMGKPSGTMLKNIKVWVEPMTKDYVPLFGEVVAIIS